jgi:hypothetical protein
LRAVKPLLIQPALADFIGSSTSILGACSHFGHSKVRLSDSQDLPGVTGGSFFYPAEHATNR